MHGRYDAVNSNVNQSQPTSVVASTRYQSCVCFRRFLDKVLSRLCVTCAETGQDPCNILTRTTAKSRTRQTATKSVAHALRYSGGLPAFFSFFGQAVAQAFLLQAPEVRWVVRAEPPVRVVQPCRNSPQHEYTLEISLAPVYVM